jgi:transcriptional regulator with XRE-family HTH domain
MASFCERLKQLREENNWSVRQLAKLTGISHSAITYYEIGVRNPKREALEAIADAFNVDMDYLLGNSDIRKKFPINLDLFDGRTEGERETEKKLLALYDKIEDKEGLIRFIERLSALSAEQQKFVFENLLQGQ